MLEIYQQQPKYGRAAFRLNSLEHKQVRNYISLNQTGDESNRKIKPSQ